MAGSRGDAEKTDAPAKAWLAGLRAATRAIVDYALPPRCPGCGVIVGDDRQFCLACWSSLDFLGGPGCVQCSIPLPQTVRSEEHTSELQSLMRISYAVFCLKKKNMLNEVKCLIGNNQ